MDDYIAARVTGQFPVSIATSLALESLAGIYPDRPVSPLPLLQYQELWINVRTLFRNMMGAMAKEAEAQMTFIQMADAIWEEMEMIESVVKNYSRHVQVVFYVSQYADLHKRYPHALLRLESTDRQKQYNVLLNATIAALIQHQVDKKIQVFDLKIAAPVKTKAVILTHIAYDLVAAPTFKSLELVESHTGTIKSPSQWYTKFTNGKELAMIPFREDMLQIFGDSELFRPVFGRIRKAVKETAEKYLWSNITTTERIRLTIEFLPDISLKTEVKKYII